MTVYVLILLGVVYHGSNHFAAQPFPTEQACMVAAHKLFPVVTQTKDLKAYGIACAEVELTEINQS